MFTNEALPPRPVPARDGQTDESVNYPFFDANRYLIPDTGCQINYAKNAFLSGIWRPASGITC
jgi:hypothetical protein